MVAEVLHNRSLREIAEAVERSTGMRGEIIGGEIVMSRTPRGKHNAIVRRIEWQIVPSLPAGFTVLQVTSIRAVDDGEDYATPDLTVLSSDFEESDEWTADPEITELVVEVVSVSNATKDATTMPLWYAQQGVPLFLLVDPRRGGWTLYSAPRAGEYRGTLRGVYGEPVKLPAPFDFQLETDGFPVYGPAPA